MTAIALRNTAAAARQDIGTIFVASTPEGQVCIRTYMTHQTSVVYLDVAEATDLIAALTEAAKDAVA